MPAESGKPKPSELAESVVESVVDALRRYFRSVWVLNSWRDSNDVLASPDDSAPPLPAMAFFFLSYVAFAGVLKLRGIATLDTDETLRQVRDAIASISIANLAVAGIPFALLVLLLSKAASYLSPRRNGRGVVQNAYSYAVGLGLLGIASWFVLTWCMDALPLQVNSTSDGATTRLSNTFLEFIWDYYDAIAIVALCVLLALPVNHLCRTIWRLSDGERLWLRLVHTAVRLPLLAGVALIALATLVGLLTSMENGGTTRVRFLRNVRYATLDITKPPTAELSFIIENRSSDIAVFERTAFVIHFARPGLEEQRPACVVFVANDACGRYYTPVKVSSWSAGESNIALLKPHENLFVTGTASVPWRKPKTSSGGLRNPFAAPDDVASKWYLPEWDGSGGVLRWSYTVPGSTTEVIARTASIESRSITYSER